MNVLMKILALLFTILCFQKNLVLALPKPILFGFSRYRGESRPTNSGRSYNDIARVINPNPYNNIGSNPYPGQPFWTYG